MAKRSIPSWTPANGRISTPSLGRSRKQKAEDFSGKQESRKQTQGPNFCRLRGLASYSRVSVDPCQLSPSCVRAFLSDSLFFRRVKGAWWPSRSSKSPSVLTDRGRFDSYPLRPKDLSGKQESRNRKQGLGFCLIRRLALTGAGLVGPLQPSLFLRSCVPEKFPARSKGGDPHVARANP